MSYNSLINDDSHSAYSMSSCGSDNSPLLVRKASGWNEHTLYHPGPNLSSRQDFELAKAQLKASSRTSGLLSGFAMVALVEMQYQQDTPGYLLITLGVVTTLLVSVHLIALMMSTCIRPYIDSFEYSHDTPHHKFRFFIDLSWLISTWIGLMLFLIEIGIILVVKFDGVKNHTAGIVTSALLVPVVFVFCYLAYRIHQIKKKHLAERLLYKMVLPKATNFYRNNPIKIPIQHI